MGFVWRSAVKDLRRRARDPASLAIWFGIPLVVGGLLLLAFGGAEGPRPRPRVLLVDEDDTFASRLLASALGGQAGGASFASVERVERARGRARLEAGEATALLIVPAGFGRALFEDRPVTLELVTNPAQQILPGLVEEAFDLLTDAVFYLQRLVGDPYRALVGTRGEEVSDPALAAFSVEIARLARRLDGRLYPPLIELRSRVEGETGAPRPSLGLRMLPGLLFMVLMFVGQGLSDDVWDERAFGTLRRALTTPQGAGAFLAGKLLAGALVMAAVSLLVLALMAWLYGLGWAPLPLALAWTSLSGVLLLLLFMLLSLHASAQRAASTLSTLVLIPLMMLGGTFFPFDVMPRWMAAVGAWTPNGFALLRLQQILSGTSAPGALLAAAWPVLLACAVLFALALHRLRGRFATG